MGAHPLIRTPGSSKAPVAFVKSLGKFMWKLNPLKRKIVEVPVGSEGTAANQRLESAPIFLVGTEQMCPRVSNAGGQA